MILLSSEQFLEIMEKSNANVIFDIAINYLWKGNKEC